MMKKTIILGISGGIAAYKSAQLASNLVKKGHDVHVVMTKNATEFIAPLTLEVLTNHKVTVDTFDRNFNYNVNHVSLSKKADVFVVAPATANVLAKFAAGMADDMLTTTYLALTCPVLVAPAMNTAMLEHPATQRNMERLKQDGVHFIQPASGYLACGDVGAGRLADVADIEEEIDVLLHKEKPLLGKKVVITAGPTMEAIDPVRFITNHSSGKMGYALAKAARHLGATVHLITGPTQLKVPIGIEVSHVTSADDMYEAAMNQLDYDYFIASAAVSDFKSQNVSDQKMKKKDTGDHLSLALVQNEDIVEAVAKKKKAHQVVCGFAMETSDLIHHAQGKLERKQLDLIVANHLFEAGAGFKGDTNKVTIIGKGKIEPLEVMDKEQLAYEILERL